MKYLLKLWALLPLLLLIKPIRADEGRIQAQDVFSENYKEFLNTTGRIYCEESKNVGEIILKDKKIREATTFTLREFRRNLTNLLELYPTYEHFGLYHELVAMFDDVVLDFYPTTKKDAESQYILKLLKKHKYDVINDKYESEFHTFMQQKLAKKVENLAKTLSDIELRTNLLEWSGNAKKCKDYDCALEHYNLLYDLLYTPREEVFKTIYEKLDKIHIIYINKSYEIMKLILKDSNLTKLTNELKDNFKRDLNDFIKKYDNKSNTLNNVLDTLHHNIYLKYYKNTKIAEKDQKLLTKLFKKYAYVKWRQIHYNLLNDFIKNQLFDIIDGFEDTLIDKALKQERVLFAWYENLKTLKTYEKKLKAINELNAIQ